MLRRDAPPLFPKKIGSGARGNLRPRALAPLFPPGPLRAEEKRGIEPRVEAKGAGETVLGVITFDGKPLEGATIRLLPAKGAAVAVQTLADGTYQALGLATGKHRVTISAVRMGKEIIPAKYSDPEKSGLVVEIVKGENRVDFSLASK